MFPSLVLTELVTSDGSSHLGYENSVTRVLQECYNKSVTRVLLHESITVTRMLQVIVWLAKSL